MAKIIRTLELVPQFYNVSNQGVLDLFSDIETD